MPSLRLIGKQIKNQKSEYLQKWAYDSNYQKKKSGVDIYLEIEVGNLNVLLGSYCVFRLCNVE